METQALAILREMLLLTRRGSLIWSREQENGWFEGVLAGKRFVVEFLYLARTDEVGSDRTIARINAFEFILDYSIGTEGFDLICDMLAFGDPEWMKVKERAQQNFAKAMDFLSQQH